MAVIRAAQSYTPPNNNAPRAVQSYAAPKNNAPYQAGWATEQMQDEKGNPVGPAQRKPLMVKDISKKQFLGDEQD